MFLLSYTNRPPQVIKEQLPLQVTQHNCVEHAEESVKFSGAFDILLSSLTVHVDVSLNTLRFICN